MRLWSVPLAGSAVDLGTFLRLLGGIVKVGGALLGERARENEDVLEEKNAFDNFFLLLEAPVAVGRGGVNHCQTVVLHCRLAKSRGLMRRGKYGAVIGQKNAFLCMCPV